MLSLTKACWKKGDLPVKKHNDEKVSFHIVRDFLLVNTVIIYQIIEAGSGIYSS